MNFLFNNIFLQHNTGHHPENKKRIECLGNLPQTDLDSGEPHLGLIHSNDYIEKVKEYCASSRPLDADTLTSPESYKAAVYAVGAAIKASETNSFAMVRPPGHHAYPTRGSGFCLFNNMAIAVEKLVRTGKRVAIIDIDGHYGDGTAFCFYKTDRVLFCSLHQYPAFPGNGFCDETGEGAGKGFTVNVPLPAESADDLFLKTLREVFIPVVQQYQPDIVGISAGFDAYRNDPLLNLKVSQNGYYKCGELLGKKFNPLFAVLEGGYNTDGLKGCINNFINGINGKPMHFNEEETLSPVPAIKQFDTRLNILRAHLKDYWKF